MHASGIVSNTTSCPGLSLKQLDHISFYNCPLYLYDCSQNNTLVCIMQYFYKKSLRQDIYPAAKYVNIQSRGNSGRKIPHSKAPAP